MGKITPRPFFKRFFIPFLVCLLSSWMYATPGISVDSVVKVSCNGDTDGAISITISGIVGTRSISWTGPNGYSNSTAEDISNLAAGDYIVTVTDSNDNSSSTETITVGTEIDNQNPTISAPTDKTAFTSDDGSGNCTTTVNLGSPNTNDNCGVQGVKAYVNGAEINPATYDFPIGTTTVKWEVTDNAGLKATDNQAITISDNEAPTITAPADKTANTDVDGTGNCTTTVNLGSPNTNDNCGIQGVKAYVNGTEIDPSTYDFPIGTTSVKWEVTDNAGLTATDTQTITVSDNEAPSITAPADKTANTDEDGTGNCTTKVNLGSPSNNDNCGIQGVKAYVNGTEINPSTYDFPIGTTSVKWEVTDNAGLKATDTQTVSVSDNEAPVISCIADQSKDTDTGACDYTVQGSEFDPTSFSDNCSGASINNDYNNSSSLAGAIFPKGTTTVIWTVTDAAGNPNTCSFDVTVSDNEDPVISCIADQNKNTDTGACDYTVQGSEFDPTSFTDNCSGATIKNDYNSSNSLAGAVFPKGTTTVTWTVTDASNNTATCSFDVTVSDSENPVISCIVDQNKNTDTGSCDYTVQGNEFDPISFGDNCSGATIKNDYNSSNSLAGAVFPKGTTTVTWTVTDASNNTATCSFDVTVSDSENPVISCITDQNKNTDTGACDYTVQGSEFDPTSFSDNCSGATIKNDYNNSNSLAGAVFPKGTTTVIWTVTDAAGNTNTCSFDVTVSDNEDPVIGCIADQNKNTDTGACDYTVQGSEFDPTSFSDNCSGATIKNDYNNSNFLAGAVFPKGTTTVTWTVTDAAGNPDTCSFDVTVSDNEDPVISCIADQNRDTDTGACDYTVQATEFDPTSFSDNCSGATIKNDYNNSNSLAGAVFPKGTTAVIWTVTDAAGNTNTCSFDVTVSDNENPVISCIADQNRDTDTGACDYTVQGSEFDPTSFSDNCSGATIKNDYNNSNSLAGAVFPKGTTTVTWTVTDAAGNPNTCSFDVTVSDNEIPVISVGDDKTVNNDPGSCTATVSVANATASDNCGVGVPEGTRDDGEALNAPYPVGTTTITWQVSDNNGNAATPVDQKITVKDNEAPVPPSLSDITWGCEYTVEVPVATDNCGNQYSGVANRSTTFSSTGTITWTFTDDAGNSSTANQTITISPVQATTSKVDVLCHGAATGEIHVTASGGIEPYTYTWNSLGTGADQTGLTAGTYTVTVSDANGCTTNSISVTITEPEQLQMANPQMIPVTCNGANNGEVQAGNVNGGVPGYLYKITDNTSGQDWNYQAAGKFTDLKPGDYTLTVQDNNGCTLGKDFTITEPAELYMEEPSSTEVTCFGGSDGTVTAGNVTGGNGDYLYSINNTDFGTSSTFTGLIAGTHTIFVKDAKGCALQKTVTVTEPEELSANISVTNVKCYDGDTGVISVNNASGGHNSYEYSIDGSTWQTSNQFSGLSKGTYSVFIRDKDYPGCAINLDSAVTITQPSAPVTAQISTTRTTEYGSSTGTATANGSGGTPGYTYEWRKKGESTVLQTTKTATNLAAGYYEVTVTDKNGCQFTTELRIIDTILATIIPTSICDDEESLIRTSYFEVENLTALGGVGPYTYEWNFGTDATPATGTGPGSHQVKYSSTGNKDITLVVTDSLNVSKTFTFTQFVGECYHDNCGSNDFYIESYYVGDANGNKTTAINCADGAQRYLYVNLSNNSTRYSLYAEFTYTITHLDSGQSETFNENGCFYSKEAIPQNAQTIAIDWTCGDVITVDNIYLTFSNNDNWTCGQGPNPKCFSTNNQEVVISPLYAKATPNELLCYGSDFGEIEVHATGGKPPYQYSITSAISGFQSDNVFSGLNAGDYNVWVKDSEGTIFEIPTVTISQPDSPITLDLSVENAMCFGETGTATVNASGGTPFAPGELPGDAKYKYLWNDPTEQETATATGLTAEEYTVTVIDANGCQTLETVTITQPEQLTEANAGEDQTFGCGFTSTTLNANTPEVGEGSWSIGEGSDAGGEFSDPSAPDSEFSSPDGGTFYLHWTIANTNCSNDDEVVVKFEGNCSTLDFDGVDDYITMGDSYDLSSGSFTLEAWVKPKAVDGTRTVLSRRNSNNLAEGGYDLIINNGAPTFRWGSNAVSTSYKIGTDRWYHLAVVYQNSKVRLYVDGIEVGNHSATNPAAISSSFLIGAMYNPSNPDVPKNYFKGWIEEVRIWKTALSVEQLHILMNQRLQESGGYAKGTVLPTTIPGNPLWSTSYPTWSTLSGYYQLLVSDITADGYTPDLASAAVNGKLKNIETIQENTAPVPYTLYTDNQEWFNKSSWNLPSNYNGQAITARDVWDPPSSPGITGDTIAWNIVDLNGKSIKNVGTTNNSNSIDLLGLLDNGGTLKMDGTNNTSGNGLTVTHYLELDGIIDLEGESQLIQSTGSVAEGSGHIEKDQQGTESSFNYNYWSSPVIPAAGDLNYKVAEVMFDGTTTGTDQYKSINFNGQYWWADGPKQNPIKISNYWINTFRKKQADEYSDWERIGSNTDLKIGEGYTMKGTSGAAAITDPQNYTFKGFPNNGDITLSGIAPEQNYLIGNPYPSAISADEFILDHLAASGGTNSQNVFNGTIYYWDHFSGKTHYLQRYIGGYAMYNLSGGVRAIAVDDRINNTQEEGNKKPGPYIPVAQAFFINTATGGWNSETESIQGGDITFKNKYRVYVSERNSSNVQFLKPAEHTKEQAIAENKFRRDNRYKIRLKFHSPTGYLRELLVTADANTTNGVDLGYDAPLLDTSEEDMFWLINGGQFAIQGVPNFNIDQVLPLGIMTSEKGEIEIKIEELENLPENISIYLRDNSDSTYFDLRKASYKAELDPGYHDSRYDLVFDDGSKKISQQGSEEENLGVAYLSDKHQIELNNPDLLDIEQVYIYGMSGQEVEAFYDVQTEKKILLDLKKPLSTSVYIVKVYSGEKIISKKIIIKE